MNVRIAFGIFGVAALLNTFFTPVSAQTASGNVTINGVINSPPPSTAPTIEQPAPGAEFQEKSITVNGSCISGLIVKVYRNNFFAGSSVCVDGKYTLPIDLFAGENVLIARQFDIIGQSSPDSNQVAVIYTPAAPQLPNTITPVTPQNSIDTPELAQFQLIIDYDYTLQSIYANKPFYLPIKFAGGIGPYAVTIDWGDGASDVFSRSDTTSFTVEHTYAKAGYYTATIKVSDSKNDRAALQFVLLASGELDTSLINQIASETGSIIGDNPIAQTAIIGSIIVVFATSAFAIGLRIGKTRPPKT
jgi:hypothetical protein